MSEPTGRKRLLLGAAAAITLGLGAGGVAYAATDDPVVEQGYVTIQDDPSTAPAPEENGQGRDGRNCPEKDGTGGSEQGEAEQGPAEQGEAEQGTTPQPSEDLLGQA